RGARPRGRRRHRRLLARSRRLDQGHRYVFQARMTIRVATHRDIPGILKCLGSAFAPYRTRYAPAAYEDTVLTPASAKWRLEHMTVFVAEGERGEIAGTVACEAARRPDGHIRGMAVVEAMQGTGLAVALLEAAERELATAGCQRVTLDTTEV